MHDDVARADATNRFTSRATAYDAGRPPYPTAAIDAIFDGCGDPASLRVADLGAGTGIGARALAARGAPVVAVEPNAAMRARAATGDAIVWRDARAEATGLEASSIDLATAFQAFHWFEPVAAVREISRILRPGGRFAIVYNERDERDAFTAAYGALVRRFATDATESRRIDVRARFRDDATWVGVREAAFANRQPLARAGVHARALSTSYLPTTGPAGDELHAAIDALVDAFATGGTVAMVYETTVTIATAKR